MNAATANGDLLSFSEAARLLGTDCYTISGIVRAKGLPVHPGHKRLMKGLDSEAIAILREALKPINGQRSSA